MKLLQNKYLGLKVKSQNYIRGESKSELNPEIVRCHFVQNLLSSIVLSKNLQTETPVVLSVKLGISL
jgi:hypothetical protein